MPKFVPILRLALWKWPPNHLARQRISSLPTAKENQGISSWYAMKVAQNKYQKKKPERTLQGASVLFLVNCG
jgi:hypothetical protein